MRRPTVYVSGKFTGVSNDEERANIKLACQFGAQLWQLGFAAYTPHTNCMMLTETSKKLGVAYEDHLDFDLWLLTMFDAIYMLPNWEDSPGAIREKALASSMKIPVFYSIEAARAWLRNRKEE